MKRGIFSVMCAVVLMAAAATGCGGRSGVDLESGHGAAVIPVSALSHDVGNSRDVTEETSNAGYGIERISDDVLDTEALGLGYTRPSPIMSLDMSVLPDVNTDYPGSVGARSASAVTSIDLSMITADTSFVTYAEGVLSLPSEPDTTEWVRYALPLAEDEDLIGLSVTGSLTPAATGSTGLWVGLSNYTEGHWVFFGPYDLANQVIIDSIDAARYSNLDDEMHLVLVTTRGDQADITQVQINRETPTINILPDEFYSALTNAGLTYDLLSLRQGHEVLDPFDGLNYGTWGWYLYSYDGGENFYEDLRTLLPSYWGVWSGNDGGPFEPHEYPEYISAKEETLTGVTSFQDLLMAGIEEMPADRQSLAQEFNPVLQSSDALARAIADYVTAAGGTADYATYQTALASLTKEDQDALARVVLGAKDAYEARDEALTTFGLEAPDVRDSWFWWSHGYWAQTGAYVPALVDAANYGNLLRGYPYATTAFEGSCKIADAIDKLIAYIDTNDPAWEDVNLEVETPAGRIVISGIGDDAHNQHRPAIVGKDQGTGTYSIAGDMTAQFPADTSFTVYGATGDNGLKTVISATVNGLNTDIVVNETLEDGTADGEIRLNGYAILIDLGGNDTYTCTAGATASGANGVSVCLDMSGDDTYLALDDPLDGNRGAGNDDNYSQYGAGRLGVGLMVDFDGADTYEASRLSQGFAMLGVGALADIGEGDDVYTAEGFSQGSAIGGVGLLFDDGAATGNQYNIWGFGQGYGGIMGIGMLVQHGESNDMFYAEPNYDAARPEYDSAQVPGVKNASFAQGSALGIRWGAVNPATGVRFIAAGGYGVIYDEGGNDQYTCGVFGQAMGFFHGHGVLIDVDGDDTHDGVWYTQGATAHCGVAGFYDGGGDDTYTNETSIGIGGAHDWSVTWFYDRAGNDTYNASSLALGTGYSNSYCYMIDMFGNDTYNATYSDGAIQNLGRAMLDDAGRDTQRCYGIFVDVRGVDTYDAEYAGMLSGADDTELVDTPPDNGAAWVRAGGSWDGGGGYYDLGFGSGVDGQ